MASAPAGMPCAERLAMRTRFSAIQYDRSVCGASAAQGEFRARHERRRYGCDLDRGEHPFGGVDFADEELAARVEQARVESIGVIAERNECPGHLDERMRGLIQIAHRQRDFDLGDLAARLRERLAHAETACNAAQELARSHVVAELR
jgi:hypothetical protein